MDKFLVNITELKNCYPVGSYVWPCFAAGSGSWERTVTVGLTVVIDDTENVRCNDPALFGKQGFIDENACALDGRSINCAQNVDKLRRRKRWDLADANNPIGR